LTKFQAKEYRLFTNALIAWNHVPEIRKTYRKTPDKYHPVGASLQSATGYFYGRVHPGK